jgi:hypothetical protein
MANKDLYHNSKVGQALAPAARSANSAVNGSDIDTTGFEAILFVLNIGAWTDGTHTPKLQEADDNGSGSAGAYSDVAAGNLLGSFTAVSGAGGQNTTQKVGMVKTKKFARIVLTTSGATTGLVSGATYELGGARNLPQPYTDTTG